MGEAVIVAVPLLIAAIVLSLGMCPIGRRQLERFGARFGVVVEDDDGALVAARLRRSRVLRSTTVALGLAVGGLPAYMNLIDPERAGAFAIAPVGWAWLFGAAAAAVAAEVFVVQRPVRRGEAALVERLPEHYVSPRWIRMAVATAVTALMFFVAAVIRTDAALLEPATGAAGALVTLCAVTVGLRRIADRPRLGVAGPLQALDDALRAYGAHHVVGASIALGTVSLALAAGPVFNEVAPALNLVTYLLVYPALVLWFTIARDEPWRAQAPQGSTP